MQELNYKYGEVDEDIIIENNIYLLKNKSDIAELIEKVYKGRIDKIGRIPINKWFIYHVDDNYDYLEDEIILIEDYKKTILKTIIEASKLFDFIENNCK